jgi:HSP20 family protein
MVRWPFFEPSPMRDLLEAFLQDDRRRVATSRTTAGGQALGQPMPVNVHQDSEAMIVEAMIPGAGPDDIDIQCAEGLLTIRARMPVADHDYVHQEIQPTDWFRQLALPAELKYEQAEADATNGMLTIRIPKTRPRTPEKIRIQVSRKGSEPATIDAQPGEGYSEVKPKRPRSTE